MQGFVPQSPEAWAFLTLVFTTFGSGVGFVVKIWADRRISIANQSASEAASAATRLAEAQDRLVDSAEKRETAANLRLETALAALASLTTIVKEQALVSQSTLEEVRRANSHLELLLRERR